MTQEYNESILVTNIDHQRHHEETERLHKETIQQLQDKYERQMNYAKNSHNKILKDNIENFKLEYGDALEATLVEYEKKLIDVETENTCILEQVKYIKLG